MQIKIKIFAQIGILIALYYFSYYLFTGIIHPIPAPGDSWDYHIPIEKTILNGSFLHLTHPKLPQWYYLGSSEAINSLFILFHIPLTLSNLFAAIVLFFVCYKLAQRFDLKKYYAMLFAITFVTLNVIVRWANFVNIDTWMGIWFALSIIMLERPEKNVWYFGKLGFVLGMLIGTKYSGLYFLVILSAFYLKNILRYSNIQRLITFIIPFSLFGLFWYFRNYLMTGNPFYPIRELGFKGPYIFPYPVWLETFYHPLEMFNAGFGEYHLWLFSVLIALIFLIYQYLIKRKMKLDKLHKLFLIGIINFIIYFTFPTSFQTWIMVSSFRFSYPTFIPLILGVFIFASQYKHEDFVGYFAVANMLNVLTMAYYPKLIFIYLPLSFLIFYFLHRTDMRKKIKIVK